MRELNQAAGVIDKLRNVKVRVELSFNGNCAEAIALYEKAFGIKVEYITRYKDAPKNEFQYPEGTEDYVLHTWLKLGNDPIGEIGVADRLPGRECSHGDGVSVSVGLDSADAVRSAFDVLKEGGKVGVANFCVREDTRNPPERNIS